MKITAEFNNVEEVKEFLAMFGQTPKVVELTKKEGKKEAVKTEVKQEPTKVEVPKVEAEVVKVDEDPVGEVKEAEIVKEEPKANVNKEMVRAVFTKVIKAGKQKEAKELTLKYGASKLGEVKEKDYAAIYKDAEELL